MKYIYVALLAVGLVILGDSYPKIALAVAALILLGTMVLHIGPLKNLMEV